MKVLLLNSSRRKEGCTYTALSVVANALQEQSIETEIIHAVPTDTVIKEVAEKLKTCDGIVLGSPVYWASPTGEVITFLDKLCTIAGKELHHKVGAVVVSARRAGTTASLDVLLKYLSYHQMIIVSSNYWNMIHGNRPDEVQQDIEGLQIMRTLGKNMAWIMSCIDAGKKVGITPPITEQKIMTNYIR